MTARTQTHDPHVSVLEAASARPTRAHLGASRGRRNAWIDRARARENALKSEELSRLLPAPSRLPVRVRSSAFTALRLVSSSSTLFPARKRPSGPSSSPCSSRTYVLPPVKLSTPGPCPYEDDYKSLLIFLEKNVPGSGIPIDLA